MYAVKHAKQFSQYVLALNDSASEYNAFSSFTVDSNVDLSI